MRTMLMMVSVLALAAGAPAYAAGNTPAAKEEKAADPVVKELRSANNPHIKKVEDKARGLISPLTQPQMKYMLEIREAYGVVRSVEIVEKDVARAVRLCGEDNPGIKDSMSDRFAQWTGSVSPILKGKMDAIQAAIDKQDFTPPAKVRDYLKTLDDAARYAEGKFKKEVLTSPAACESLRKSMDRTEDDVVRLMSALEVPVYDKAAETVEDPAGESAPKKSSDDNKEP